MNEYEKIIFDTDDGQVAFFILDDTKINEINYLLVTSSEDPEAEEIDVLFLKEVSVDGEEATYEIVTDEDEIVAIAPLFEETMGDNIEFE